MSGQEHRQESGRDQGSWLSWPPDPAWWQAFLVGYQTGIEHGTNHGYREAMTVLDEAGAFLAAQRPSSNPSFAELQRRRNTRTTPALTPAQIRVQSARSWGFEPDPADVAQARADEAAARGPGTAAAPTSSREPAATTAVARQAEPVVEDTTTAAPDLQALTAEFADDDDWAWQA